MTEINKESFLEICNVVSKLESSKDAENFLKELLAESELEAVIQRWNILRMLVQQESQRSISSKLSVSLCKITRGSKILKNKDSILRKILFDESWRS